jgi:hypothetical protein
LARKKSRLFVRQAHYEENHFRPNNDSPGCLNDMPRHKAPGTVPFSLDISLEAKLRFAGLHDALGFRTKAATFEAIVYAVSTKDKIDPAAVERIERKLDRFLERFDDSV